MVVNLSWVGKNSRNTTEQRMTVAPDEHAYCTVHVVNVFVFSNVAPGIGVSCRSQCSGNQQLACNPNRSKRPAAAAPAVTINHHNGTSLTGGGLNVSAFSRAVFIPQEARGKSIEELKEDNQVHLLWKQLIRWVAYHTYRYSCSLSSSEKMMCATAVFLAKHQGRALANSCSERL